MQMSRLLLVTFCALALGRSSWAQTGERERLESERAAISERIAATQSVSYTHLRAHET